MPPAPGAAAGEPLRQPLRTTASGLEPGIELGYFVRVVVAPKLNASLPSVLKSPLVKRMLLLQAPT